MANNRYCRVIELKPEHVQEYCDIHRNPWAEILPAIQKDDLGALYAKLGPLEAMKRWNAKVGPWFSASPKLDGSGKVTTCEKIFDLNQQLRGTLEPY
jgi:L-rhamnose mutarotase